MKLIQDIKQLLLVVEYKKVKNYKDSNDILTIINDFLVIIEKEKENLQIY